MAAWQHHILPGEIPRNRPHTVIPFSFPPFHTWRPLAPPNLSRFAPTEFLRPRHSQASQVCRVTAGIHEIRHCGTQRPSALSLGYAPLDFAISIGNVKTWWVCAACGIWQSRRSCQRGTNVVRHRGQQIRTFAIAFRSAISATKRGP